MKVACDASHGDEDASCQDDAAKLATEAIGLDRNPSYLSWFRKPGDNRFVFGGDASTDSL
jgi:hypothetical protein